MIKAAGYNSNLLLNVGPMPNGKIQIEHIESLREIGKWLRLNGESIYGTSQGPINPSDEIVSTMNGEFIYIHLLANKNTYFIEGFNPKIKTIRYLKSNNKVQYQKTKSGLIISIDSNELNEIDTILKLEV